MLSTMLPGAQLDLAAADALADGFGLALAFGLGVVGLGLGGGVMTGVVSAGVAAGLPYAPDGSGCPDRSAAMDDWSAADVAADGPLPVNIQASTARTARPPPRMKKRRRQYAPGSADWLDRMR